MRIPLACCPGSNSVPRENAGAEHTEVYEYALGEESPAAAEFYSTEPPEELCNRSYDPPPPSMPPPGPYYDDPDYYDDYDLGCSGGACSVSGFGVTGAPVLLTLILTARRRRQL